MAELLRREENALCLTKSLRVLNIIQEEQDNWAVNKEHKKTKSVRQSSKSNMKNMQPRDSKIMFNLTEE